MNRYLPIIACFLLCAVAASPVAGQLTTDSLGVNRVDCPAASDTVASIPFARSPAYTGRIDSSPTPVADGASLSPEGSPGFSTDQFVATPHYLRFTGTGAMAGGWYEVVANDTSSITIETNGEDLSSAVSGDPFEIVPYWTLSTIWPVDTQDSLHLSTGKLLSGRGSSVMLADTSASNTDLAPNRIFFLTSEGWFSAASGFPEADDVVIPPGQSFIIRHPDDVTSTVFCPLNLVHDHDQRVWLKTSTEGRRDNHLAIARPVPVSLANLGLDSTAFRDSPSTHTDDRTDELLIYDNAEVGHNKTPDSVYFRVSGVWRKDDSSTYPISSDVIIEPSSSIVIRKYPTANGESVLWVNTPQY